VFGWDSGNNLGELSMHSQQVISVSYRKQRPFRVATASEDLTVNIYEGPPFKFSAAYKGHSRYPNCVRFSPDGEFYATVGADQKIVLFNGTSGEVIREVENKQEGHKGAIYSFAWSPDSKQILTSSADKTAKIWNIEDSSVKTTFNLGKDTLDQQVGALWSGDFLISVSLSGAINYLDVTNPSKPKRVIHGHQTSITSLVIGKGNNKFYTAGLTGEVTAWDFNSGEAEWFRGKGHQGKVVQALSLNKSATKLSSYGLDDKIRANEVKSQEFNDSAAELGGMPVFAAASHVDDSLAAAVLAQEKLVLLRNGSPVQTIQLGYTPTTVKFNSSGDKLIVGGKNKQVQLYNLKGDSAVAGEIIKSHDKPVTAVVSSPDGQLYASVDTEKSIYLHSTANLELKNKSGWRFHNAGVLDVDFSPSSARLVTGSIDCAIILWNDLKGFSGSERTKITNAHADAVTITKFWDDNTLLSLSADRCIKIWKV
jgi:WD40 repeat protein